MPRPPSQTNRTRFNMEMAPAARERLERVQIMAEADSLTEAIRRAVAVYETLLLARERGARLRLTEADGTERDLLLT